MSYSTKRSSHVFPSPRESPRGQRSRATFLPVHSPSADLAVLESFRQDAWKRGMGLRAQLLDTYLQKQLGMGRPGGSGGSGQLVFWC